MAFPTHEQTIKTKGTAKQDNSLHRLEPKIGAKLDLHASAANGAVHAGAQPEEREGEEEEEEEREESQLERTGQERRETNWKLRLGSVRV